MRQTMHFISGLPRSGSTLLGAILRQNPRFHASMTGPVGGLFRANMQAMSAGSELALLVTDEQRRALLKGLFTSFYGLMTVKQVVFDTNRQWTAHMSALRALFPDARVIATVRSLAWVMDSLERLFRNDPFEKYAHMDFWRDRKARCANVITPDTPAAPEAPAVPAVSAMVDGQPDPQPGDRRLSSQKGPSDAPA